MVEKEYKFRFYPTPEQENLLWRTLSCVCLVYNKALAVRNTVWYEHKERVSYKQTSPMLTSQKKQKYLDFLTEVSSVLLYQGLRHLQTAFPSECYANTNFFSGPAKHPNFSTNIFAARLAVSRRAVGGVTYCEACLQTRKE